MITSPTPKKRILVPQWRSIATTLRAGELAPPLRENVSRSGEIPQLLLSRLAVWRRNPSIISAAEILETALVHNLDSEALPAARLIAAPNSGATPLLRKQANRLLIRAGEAEPEEVAAERSAPSRAYWRQRTRDFPRDALAWVELALAQICNPHQVDEDAKIRTPAERSMTIALQLAPNNRHVLRAAARLYVHLHDWDRAHELLRRAEATPHDPWLMAAEIAIAQCSTSASLFMKKGMQLLEGNQFVPRQITELAGAIGTSFLFDGNHKRGKKMFARSLHDPTANAIAQAEWASQSFEKSLVSEYHLKGNPEANEARSMHAFRAGQLSESLNWTKLWIEQEPFSSRPYIAASATASLADEYADAEHYARAGLAFDHKSLALINALAFSLASRNDLSKAEAVLRDIPSDSDDKTNARIADANRGLIAMRRGQLDAGAALYKKAITGFRAEGNDHLARAALLYLRSSACPQ